VRVAIGSDHAGFELKERIKALLDEWKVPCDDLGPSTTASVDYPDFAEAVARRVTGGAATFGILVCGTGIGMAMAANKIRGIRAAVVWDGTSARLSRQHNDANVMTIGGRTTPPDQVPGIVSAFLNTGFDDGRHSLRLDKIAALERKDA
jgi:ribose 5-phosphate isomerase B